MTSVQEFKIENGYEPGAIGRIAELHGTYYHIHWGVGLYFEAKVATELSAFLRRYKTYFWTFEGLNAARHLYKKAGFQLIKQQSGVHWGTTVNEQYFELRNE